MKKGHIYILINESLKENCLKIGVTTIEPDKFAKEFSEGRGLPSEFIVGYEKGIPDCEKAKDLISEKLEGHRFSIQVHKKDSGFFDMPLQKAVALLHQIAKELALPAEEPKEEQYIEVLARETEVERKERIRKEVDDISKRAAKKVAEKREKKIEETEAKENAQIKDIKESH